MTGMGFWNWEVGILGLPEIGLKRKRKVREYVRKRRKGNT